MLRVYLHVYNEITYNGKTFAVYDVSLLYPFRMYQYVSIIDLYDYLIIYQFIKLIRKSSTLQRK